MEYETVLGEEIPKIGLGTWQLTGRTCRRTVRRALEMGYRHIDTAQAYGNEREVGQAISESSVERDEVFLTTKVRPSNRDERSIVESAIESVGKLGVDSVDLLLIHWPHPLANVAEVMRGLNACREPGRGPHDRTSERRGREYGLTRHVGVSNYSADQLRTAQAASDAPILTNQVQFHPYCPQRDLRAYCRAHGVLLTAYSPLARGGVLRDATLREIGVRYGKSPAQVALRWAIQQEGVVAIPKATSEEHLRANLDVFDFELTDPEMVRIERPSRLRTGVEFVRSQLGV